MSFGVMGIRENELKIAQSELQLKLKENENLAFELK